MKDHRPHRHMAGHDKEIFCSSVRPVYRERLITKYWDSVTCKSCINKRTRIQERTGYKSIIGREDERHAQ